MRRKPKEKQAELFDIPALITQVRETVREADREAERHRAV